MIPTAAVDACIDGNAEHGASEFHIDLIRNVPTRPSRGMHAGINEKMGIDIT